MNFAFSSRATLGVCLCGLSACRAIVITPQALRTAAVPELERSELARTWTEAVARCNAFQSSPFRHALPPGRFVLDDVQGMRFEGLQGAWPIEVRCTGWGDVVQAFGFVAQEGRGGFTVGDCNPERDQIGRASCRERV